MASVSSRSERGAQGDLSIRTGTAGSGAPPMISPWNRQCLPDRSSSARPTSPSSSPCWRDLRRPDGARLGGARLRRLPPPQGAAPRPRLGRGRARRGRRPGGLRRGRLAGRLAGHSLGSPAACSACSPPGSAAGPRLRLAPPSTFRTPAAAAARPRSARAADERGVGTMTADLSSSPTRPAALVLRGAAGRAGRLPRLRPAADRPARRPALAGLGAGGRAARDPPPDHRAAPP